MSNFLHYPENTVWYIEARPWNGPKNKEPGFAQADPVSCGSGCAITITKTDSPDKRRPLSFILTCAHLVRDKQDCLLEDIICYPPGYGYVRTLENSRRCGTFPYAEAYAATVSKYSPCQGLLGPRDKNLQNATASDWVLLEISDPNFLHRPTIRVFTSQDFHIGQNFSTIGFPFGAGTIDEKDKSENSGKNQEYKIWKNGKIIIPTRARSFRLIGHAEPGILDYEGPEETRPGMSGGGLFDDEGVFIGIHRSATDATMKRGAISAEAIARFLRESHQIEFFSLRNQLHSRLDPEKYSPNSSDSLRSESESIEEEYQELALKQLIDGGASEIEIKNMVKELNLLRRKSKYSVDLKKGKTISDRYILVGKQGSGGFGEVWTAWDRKLNQIVALKFLHQHLGKDNAVSDRFCRGARQLQKLNHPNIIRILAEPVEYENYLYYAMQFIEKGNFYDAIVKKKFTVDDSLKLIIQIGTALQYMHDNKVIHRDVKPQNILIDGDGSGILVDFDLVRADDTFGFTQTSSFGTHLYSAPEVMNSAKKGDHRSDIFSLGMTTVFAIFGQDLPHDIIRDTPAFIETLSVSDAVKGVLERSVEWEVNGRFPKMKEFTSELEKAWQTSWDFQSSNRSRPLTRLSKPELLKLVDWYSSERIAYQSELDAAASMELILRRSPPKTMEGIKCFSMNRNASAIGGNHFDFLELQDGRIAIIIADVIGASVVACLMKCVFATLLERICLSNCSARSIMAELNETITALNAERFITASLLVFDPVENEVEIVMAGHMPPLLRSADATISEPGEDISGPPLGIMSDIEFGSFKQLLRKGDILVLYTHGVYEASNTKGEEFKTDKIRLLLEGSDDPVIFGMKLFEEIDKHIAGCQQTDDMSVICLGF